MLLLSSMEALILNVSTDNLVKFYPCEHNVEVYLSEQDVISLYLIIIILTISWTIQSPELFLVNKFIKRNTPTFSGCLLHGE